MRGCSVCSLGLVKGPSENTDRDFDHAGSELSDLAAGEQSTGSELKNEVDPSDWFVVTVMGTDSGMKMLVWQLGKVGTDSVKKNREVFVTCAWNWERLNCCMNDWFWAVVAGNCNQSLQNHLHLRLTCNGTHEAAGRQKVYCNNLAAAFLLMILQQEY